MCQHAESKGLTLIPYRYQGSLAIHHAGERASSGLCMYRAPLPTGDTEILAAPQERQGRRREM